MTIPKSFLKTWSGECSYQAIECFSSIDAAAKKVLPSSAAKIIVDEKSIRAQRVRQRDDLKRQRALERRNRRNK